MELEKLGFNKTQIDTLNKKKIMSVEGFLRKPPLHYYDFSKTYPLDINNSDTAKMIERHRPFAILGKCVKFDIDYKEKGSVVKLRIEDSATKTANNDGKLLFVNFIGFDQFKQSFLSQNPNSPHKMLFDFDKEENINIDILYPFLENSEIEVNDSCKKKIEYINSIDMPDIKDFSSIKIGGRDGWSNMKRSDLEMLVDRKDQLFIHKYISDDTQFYNCLKWYCRGLRIDLAIKKALLDDEFIIRRLLFDKLLLIGGFINYDDQYNSFSVLNPPVISEDIEKFKDFYIQYSSIKGLTEDEYKKYIELGLQRISSLDYIPSDTLRSMNLRSLKDTARMIHHPKSYSDIVTSKDRGVFDDLLYLALRMKLQERNTDESGIIMKNYSLMNEYVSSLPFPLTNDQKKAVNEVCRGMSTGRCVNALIQGDVGTGKTAVAFCLLLIAAASGYQTALAAPYTTLASQHYRDLKNICDKLGLKIALLTSEIKKKEKDKLTEQIKNGEINIIIGTHSIFNKSVEYKNLALIIIDEEHKFGVVHRDDFKEKALPGYHQVTMSATPIPKSLAATIYGNSTQVISILEKPAQRIPIQTGVAKKDETILDFITKEIRNRHQAYVVCPAIDSNKELKEGEKKVPTIADKEKIYREYLESLGMSLGVVTGKLKAEEKQHIMEDFTNGKIDVLMATTVIEVGINVPNATVIVITGAERFGFSTLHQLRGRVGRGNLKSYCILQSEDADSNEKLQFMCNTTDGFEIAEKDLELRGPGSLFGERQSGDNYYISLMLSNKDLYLEVKKLASYLCKDETGYDIVKRYESLYGLEENR